MKTIPQNCKACKIIFNAPLKEVNRGNAKYCSKKCFKENISKINLERSALINKPNVECSYCNKLFYKNKSQKQNSKSNLYFCCREHKDLAQRLEFGLKEIHPPHYSEGSSSYRDIALRNFPNKCAICDYDKIPQILEVHHKDRNRENNSLDNLVILCSRCHDEEHYLTKSGKWG